MCVCVCVCVFNEVPTVMSECVCVCVFLSSQHKYLWGPAYNSATFKQIACMFSTLILLLETRSWSRPLFSISPKMNVCARNRRAFALIAMVDCYPLTLGNLMLLLVLGAFSVISIAAQSSCMITIGLWFILYAFSLVSWIDILVRINQLRSRWRIFLCPCRR